MNDKKHYVLGFCINEKNNSIYLIDRTKDDWQFGLVNGIGGGVDEGETPLMAMRREFKEEVGIDQREWSYMVSMNCSSCYVHVYYAYGTHDDIEDRQLSEGVVKEVPLDSIWEMNLVSNLRWLIPMVLQGEVGSCYFLENFKKELESHE